MSTNYYFKSLEFKNYRGIKDLKINNLKRITIIGGYNGTGKSTVLEGAFLLMDRRNPVALARTYNFRKIVFQGKESLAQLFHCQNKKEKVKISAKLNHGDLCSLSIAFKPLPANLTVNVNATLNPENLSKQAINKEDAIEVVTNINDIQTESFYLVPNSPQEFSVNYQKISEIYIPPGTLITAATRNSANDDAERFTKTVKAHKINDLLEAISIVRPTIESIQLLQEGDSPVLYAQLTDGNMLPFAMLGDGVQSLLSICLAVMNAQDGVVMLDEFDSAIHYSILSKVWGIISTMANKYNCQVLAVTHSKECITAAVQGLRESSNLNDLKYIRLERGEGNEITSVGYENDELITSVESDWEIR